MTWKREVKMNRISKAKLVLWIILGVASAVAVTRFIYGLGVTTNLTDNSPWGFWIGFDVMGGVALAAGGFVIAAFNYIFGKKELHPISRAAILTAFLGYVAVAVGLLFDLGLPWNIWHLIIYWNPHSPLFEVGWCVMLYLTVLTLEFTPVVLEKYPNIPLLAKIHKVLFKIRIPLVILGIMLSTLHQSSLGSLFLAMPYRLHPLWYSPIIPLIFFISAIYLGLMMVMVESMTTSWLYKREPENHILIKLRKYALWMIGIYSAFRFGDIIFRGAGIFLYDNAWGTYLFWMEIFISVIIPLIILSVPKLSRSINFLYIAALSGVTGIVFNRLNVGGLTHLNNLSEIGKFYFPSWMEIFISAGVVSLAMLAFFFFIENFKVWEHTPEDPDAPAKVKPKFNSFNIYLGPTKVVNRTKFSFMFVLAFALSFALISGTKLEKKGIDSTEVSKARGADTLLIDGNRNNYGVAFKHVFHQQKGISCGQCHHMNKPGDKATGCYECHSYMYQEGDAFRHNWHSSSQGANLSCFECHNKNISKGFEFRNIKSESSQNKNLAVKKCEKCHKQLIPSDSKIKEIKSYITLSYTDALHKMCIGCHEEKLKTDSLIKINNPNLTKCSKCHFEVQKFIYERKLFEKFENNKWVVLPNRFDK
ncbi:Ni/Fe-hydrogenase cytochrome b subunit [Bacteroidetes/Chlorobi group bacterium ChocPot_Mid]|nr:MAG: Ni/Fe-hydrogenase cytochrome b subunit [Bacteroidetes/Chlorobi group bacterium ChocPot_Mid]